MIQNPRFSFTAFEFLERTGQQIGQDISVQAERLQIQNRQVRGVTADSRKVGSGWVFVAIRGGKSDGHQFVTDALAKGALCAIVQDEGGSFPAEWSGKPVLSVPSTRRFLDVAMAIWSGEPSLELFCFGVTGTNGKTTCTYLLEHLMNALGQPTAVMGTVDHHLGERRFETQNTTPGPEELQPRIREFLDAGAKALAMEVSSHALDQCRADSVHFDGVLFTNLTRDHLDYHKDMESYFWAKHKLFDDLLWASRKPRRVAVINADDSYGLRIRQAPGTALVSYGQSAGDYRFRIRKMDPSGMEFSIANGGLQFIGTTQMIGTHNMYNITGVVALVVEMGFGLRDCVEALASFRGVPGRLQRVPNNHGKHVFVDYAHSDDALKNIGFSLRQIRDQSTPDAKIITVFGCGGDRDKGKRPLMARAAEDFSDMIIATSDNPRTEDPERILDDVFQGFQKPNEVLRIADRAEAIRRAVSAAKVGDIVLIAGKGHEDYQIIGHQKVHFKDDEVAAEALK